MNAAASNGARRRHWVGVACAEHVAIGRADGFMQVCHGRGAPLKRLREGDLIAYCSPGERMSADLHALVAADQPPAERG